MPEQPKIQRIENPKKHDYRMARTIVFESERYTKGEAVELDPETLKFFLRNNYLV